jgi:hypothetical protein
MPQRGFDRTVSREGSLAFRTPLRNNPFTTFMRFAFGLTIALGMSFPLTGVASGRQQPGDTNPAAQAPPAAKQNPSAAQAPAENQAAAVKQEKSNAAVPPASSSSARLATAPKKRRKHTAPPSDGGPRRIVVREGGASEPAAQIVPGIPPEEAARQRQKAENLLRSADGQIQQLSRRTLDARQQETVGQIRNYMDGARSALKEGDVQRASTLAEKAHLLADDLAKH